MNSGCRRLHRTEVFIPFSASKVQVQTSSTWNRCGWFHMNLHNNAIMMHIVIKQFDMIMNSWSPAVLEKVLKKKPTVTASTPLEVFHFSKPNTWLPQRLTAIYLSDYCPKNRYSESKEKMFVSGKKSILFQDIARETRRRNLLVWFQYHIKWKLWLKELQDLVLLLLFVLQLIPVPRSELFLFWMIKIHKKVKNIEYGARRGKILDCLFKAITLKNSNDNNTPKYIKSKK